MATTVQDIPRKKLIIPVEDILAENGLDPAEWETADGSSVVLLIAQPRNG